MSANQRPRLHIAPAASGTFGDLAATLAADYGLVPDPWQALVLDDWLAFDGHGLWASLNCGLTCPRQNGKNGIIEVRELFGTVGRGEKILHTAHEVKTARKAFKRLQHFFGRSVKDPGAKFPELNERVIELRNVNGQEAIYLDNGGSVEIVARSKNSGRGFTADVLVMDEAQEMSEEDLEALMPTTSAAPLGNPQWIFTGTPPGPKVNGEVFTRTRTNALADAHAMRLCWHEWSAADPGGEVDMDDRDVWAFSNPALGARLHVSVVEGERAQFSAEGFARERLGMWAETSGGSGVIPLDRWYLAGDQLAQPAGRLAFGLDVSPDGRSASIAVSDGRFVRVIKHAPGTSWVAQACIENRDRFTEMFLDPAGPAGSLVQGLESAGITVREVTIREHVQACGGFLAAIEDQQIVHNGQAELDAAVANADRRTIGDGGWLWSRKRSSVDISPLVAVTLARWAASEAVGEADFFTI